METLLRKERNFVDARARAVFKEYDEDNSGDLDIKEFETCILRLYDILNRRLPLPQELQPPSKQGVATLLKKYDINKDGRLNADEFSKFAVELVNGHGTFLQSLSFRMILGTTLKLLIWPLFAYYIAQAVGSGRATELSHILEMLAKFMIVNASFWLF